MTNIHIALLCTKIILGTEDDLLVNKSADNVPPFTMLLFEGGKDRNVWKKIVCVCVCSTVSKNAECCKENGNGQGGEWLPFCGRSKELTPEQ